MMPHHWRPIAHERNSIFKCNQHTFTLQHKDWAISEDTCIRKWKSYNNRVLWTEMQWTRILTIFIVKVIAFRPLDLLIFMSSAYLKTNRDSFWNLKIHTCKGNLFKEVKFPITQVLLSYIQGVFWERSAIHLCFCIYWRCW